MNSRRRVNSDVMSFSSMLPKVLYFATGVATALQLYWAMMWAVWGRQTRTVELVAMLGSGVLIFISTFGPTQKRLTHLVAMLGSFLLWLVYGPSVPELFDPTSHWPDAWTATIILLSPFLLLIGATLCAAIFLFKLTVGHRSSPDAGRT